jgi:hypothetical protein
MKRSTDGTRLASLAPLYSQGEVSWRQIADETGASFGDLLLEIARQGLKLPIASAEKSLEQARLLDEALKGSCASLT